MSCENGYVNLVELSRKSNSLAYECASSDNDFDLQRGISYRRDSTYTDSLNQPIDLTGKVIRLYIRDSSDDSIVLTLDSSLSPTTNGSKIVITDETAGEFYFLITDEETADFAFNTGTWWMTIEDSSDVDRLGSGDVFVREPDE